MVVNSCHILRCNALCELTDFAAGNGLVCAGDGRCDSPGHSASFCTYTIMDTSTNLVLASKVIKVSEVKNSYHMEKEGLSRCLKEMKVSTEHHTSCCSYFHFKYSLKHSPL